MNPSAYDISELRDAAGVRERGQALDAAQSSTTKRQRGLPPRIDAESVRDESRYRELLGRELELAGDPEPPYLTELPRSYVGTTTVLDWVDFLLRKGGESGAVDALEFYQREGWITGRAAEHVRSHLAAATAEPTADPPGLTPSDHQLSLLYVARLAALRVE